MSMPFFITGRSPLSDTVFDEIRTNFLEQLSKPLIDRDAIFYRQAILKDFDTHRDFFEEFYVLYERFRALQESHEHEKQTLKRAITSAPMLMNLL